MEQNTNYLRLFDANLNRAREGLRVVEDTARFVLEMPALYKQLRSVRHRLERATRRIYPLLLRERDAENDSGRRIREGGRTSLAAVVGANFRRVEESMRVLEEYSKLVCPRERRAIKEMRFSVYSLEKKMAGLLLAKETV